MSGYGAGGYGAGLYGGYEEAIGAPFLLEQLDGAYLAVEIAWGADLSAESSSWTWTDITADVRATPGIEWKRGRSDEASKSNPASLTLMLDNSEYDYSLGSNSANWPYVRRGTPIRVQIDLNDGAGWIAGFLGFVDSWTPSWDTIRGNIPVVTVSASGTLRRLGQGASPVQSPYRRNAIASANTVAYWPMEEGKLATFFAPGVGTQAMTYTGTANLASDNDSFLCSTALPVTEACAFTAPVDTYASTGENQVRFLVAFPEGGMTDGAVLASVYTTGTVTLWQLLYRATGDLEFRAYNSDGSLNFTTGTVGYDLDGLVRRVSIELVQDGSDIDWVFGVTPTAGGGAFNAGTVSTDTIGIVTRVEISPGSNLDGLTVGHLTVQNEQTSFFEDVDVLAAYDGEYVTSISGRIVRLCAENDIPLTTRGDGTTLTQGIDQAGPQPIDTALSILRSCEDSDQGFLYDGGDGGGLTYLTRRYLENRSAALTIDASADELSPPFEAIDDDQRTRNKVTVARDLGGFATAEDGTGALGTAAIGIYDDALTVNCYDDETPIQIASWLVHKGTIEGYRHPSVTVDLAANAHLAADALSVAPGMRIDVTNIDQALTGLERETISLMVESVNHRITPATWQVTFTCSPYEPWRVCVLAETSSDTGEFLGRLDTDGCTTSALVAETATSMSVTIPSGPLWTTAADDYPLNLDVDGVKVTATACAGASSPQTFTIEPPGVSRPAGASVSVWKLTALGL